MMAAMNLAPNRNLPLISPGMWRPQYPWEHVAWICPPWDNDDFIWLAFPEAIFTAQGLFYLSHVNPAFPSRYGELSKVAWEQDTAGIHYQRTLPNGIAFQGSISVKDEQCVNLSLKIINGSGAPMTAIRLQTCLFMRAYYSLSAYSLDNKVLHTKEHGWVDLQKAKTVRSESGSYRFGWRGGPKIADLPVIVCRSLDDRLVAFTWLQDTYSLISNPFHPCIHADPAVPDLEPGSRYELSGEIFFANQGLDEVEDRYGP